MTPSGREFNVERNETILEAGLRAGLSLSYGCANGSCGMCKARVVSGSVEDIRFHDHVIVEAEKRMGYTLLCSCTALDLVVVEAGEAGNVDDIPVQQVPARVHKLQRIGEDIMLLGLRTPRSQVLRFLSGQHVSLMMGGLAPRNEPIASCPCDGMNLEFHLRRASGNPFVERVFAGLKKSEEVAIEGPWGRFTLDQSSKRPIIFVAYDTAFAPIRSLIEHAINLEMPQPLHLYWYAPAPGEHYLHNLCRSWADALDDFSYHPVSIEPHAEHEASVFRDYPDLSSFDVYAAGPERFLDSAEAHFLARGLPTGRLFVDAIESDV